jgi:ferredoxin
MTIKADTRLMKDLRAFGLKDAGKCFHCGNCTAVCPQSTPENPFPRKLVRYAQLGLQDKILTSSEPWLCYYCGDCSDSCPRGADPGETMMAMRRWLTSRYDWTGFARRFYKSERFEIVAISIVAVLVGLAMWIFHADNPNMEHAHLNSVWPAPALEIADLIMAAVLTFFLLSNTYRCFSFIMGDLKTKVPLKTYLLEAKEFAIHFITQKKFSLSWDQIMFQRDVIYPFFHPVRLLGYYATAALLYGTTYALIGRLKKSKAPYKNSHGTDWMFLILLQLTTLTGIFVHFTRLLDWPLTTYVLYVIHLMVAVPMLVLEVPFAKWAHLMFRPVAVYLTAVKEKYHQQEQSAA